MTVLIIYITAALAVSFLCSLLEAALLSVTPSFVARAEQDRPVFGAKLRKLRTDVDRPLAAILTLNTVAHTAGAAGAGAEAQKLWGSESLTIVSAVVTLLILVLSEIIPKTLGAVYWRPLAGFVVAIVPAIILVLTPLVWLSDRITVIIKGNRKHGNALSRDEFVALAGLAGREGVFDESETRILQNLFRFSSLTTRDIMTPRTVVFALSEQTPVVEAIKIRNSLVFSRIPLFKESLDDVTGYVLKDQLLLRAARGEHDTTVGTLRREALMVSDTLLLSVLFSRFLDSREHIAMVIDEHGGFDGVVTMEDVLETLIGLEIVDELDSVNDMRAMARENWSLRAKRMQSLAKSIPMPPSIPPALVVPDSDD